MRALTASTKEFDLIMSDNVGMDSRFSDILSKINHSYEVIDITISKPVVIYPFIMEYFLIINI